MTDTGGPAFPTKNYAAIQPLAEGYSEGMTLRDWFAGMAMQGMVARDTEPSPERVPIIVKSAYIMADAMLKERNK